MRDILIAPKSAGPLGPAVRAVETAVRVACAAILWLAFAAMLIPTFANAALRYTTNASLTWSVEIVLLVFPWFIMAGAVLAAQHGRHIGVELFVGLLPARLARWIAVPTQALIAASGLAVAHVYLGFGIYEGGMEFAAGDVAFTSIGVPQSWSYAAILAGYCGLALTALTTLHRLLADPDDPPAAG